MALKLAYTSKFGTSHSNAYHRINKVQWNTTSPSFVGPEGSGSIAITISSYATQNAKDNDSEPLIERNYNLSYTSSVAENWVSQSYEYLKTLDDFNGSENV